MFRGHPGGKSVFSLSANRTRSAWDCAPILAMMRASGGRVWGRRPYTFGEATLSLRQAEKLRIFLVKPPTRSVVIDLSQMDSGGM